MLLSVSRASLKSTVFAPSTASPRGTPYESVSTLRLVPDLARSVGLGPLFFERQVQGLLRRRGARRSSGWWRAYRRAQIGRSARSRPRRPGDFVPEGLRPSSRLAHHLQRQALTNRRPPRRSEPLLRSKKLGARGGSWRPWRPKTTPAYWDSL